MNDNQAFNIIIIALIVLYCIGQYNNNILISKELEFSNHKHQLEKQQNEIYNKLVNQYNDNIHQYNRNIQLYNNQIYNNNYVHYAVDYTYTNNDIATLRAHGLRI